MYRIVFAVTALAVTIPLTVSADPIQGGAGSALLIADNHGAMAHGAMAGDMAAGDGTYQVGDLVVEAPWSRASAGGAGAGGAFMLIHNGGQQGDRLIGAESDVAARVQLHRTVMQDGVMRMRHAEDGVEVPAGGMAELRPGGFHVMLMGLKQPLEEGSSFPVTLTFERAGTVTVDVPVMAAGAMDAGMKHDH